MGYRITRYLAGKINFPEQSVDTTNAEKKNKKQAKRICTKEFEKKRFFFFPQKDIPYITLRFSFVFYFYFFASLLCWVV